MVNKYNYTDMLHNNTILLNKKVVIWGKSISALNLYLDLGTSGINVIGFTDSFIDELQSFAGLPLFPFKQVRQMKDIVIYIATNVPQYQIEILEQLQNTNIHIFCRGTVYGPGRYNIENMKKKIENEKDKIQQVRAILKEEQSKKTFDNLIKYRITNDYELLKEIYEQSHKQYFPNTNILKVAADEVFVDAGAYNGSTTVEFSEWVNGRYKKIYMMEPDKLMQNIAKEYIGLKHMRNVEIVGKGAYSESTILNFRSDAESGSSCIDAMGKLKIETISIDQMLNYSPATYIKMDIEGAELPALIGAKETIKRYKPKLAISIYHKDDDLWNIPYYIHQKYPWYKLFIRHYTRITTETILYAVT